jgi:hypothetical protein
MSTATALASEAPLSLQNWPSAWYGYWREYGPDYAAYPSAQQFVDPSRTSQYNLVELTRYLRSGYVAAATSRLSFPCPFTGEKIPGSLCALTDGKLFWLADLPEYIERFNLAIPDAWYAEIQVNNFQLPLLTETQLEELEYPS